MLFLASELSRGNYCRLTTSCFNSNVYKVNLLSIYVFVLIFLLLVLSPLILTLDLVLLLLLVLEKP